MATRDALKFFQAYISELVEIGGENLPKSISSGLGAKLATVYKEKGIFNIQSALRRSYEVLNASPEIKEVNKNEFEIKINYNESFCPIGGEPNSSKGDLIRKSICIPYTIGFLNETNSKYFYEIDVKNCIVSSGGNVCSYALHRKRKTGEHNSNSRTEKKVRHTKEKGLIHSLKKLFTKRDKT